LNDNKTERGERERERERMKRGRDDMYHYLDLLLNHIVRNGPIATESLIEVAHIHFTLSTHVDIRVKENIDPLKEKDTNVIRCCE
jgi:hypothetical protein